MEASRRQQATVKEFIDTVFFTWSNAAAAVAQEENAKILRRSRCILTNERSKE